MSFLSCSTVHAESRCKPSRAELKPMPCLPIPSILHSLHSLRMRPIVKLIDSIPMKITKSPLHTPPAPPYKSAIRMRQRNNKCYCCQQIPIRSFSIEFFSTFFLLFSSHAHGAAKRKPKRREKKTRTTNLNRTLTKMSLQIYTMYTYRE